ncbi:hypothetical protein U1Q18_051485, partial [Sarracenia purpurea var. burkii]
ETPERRKRHAESEKFSKGNRARALTIFTLFDGGKAQRCAAVANTLSSINLENTRRRESEKPELDLIENSLRIFEYRDAA